VDDDAVLRDVFADLLGDLGHQVNVVADAGEALGRVRNEGFDVLVTDIVLLGMDGWHCCGSLRSLELTGTGIAARRRAGRTGAAEALSARGTACRRRDLDRTT